MDGYFDARAKTGEMFIHGVVQNFRNAVMERAFIGATDIHARLFSDGLKSLELA